MKLLQRYILAELLRVFSLLVIALTVMLVFVGLLREATERGLGPLQIIQIAPYVVPSMLPFTIPATLLLAVTVVYGRLAGDLEITAAKAAGVNPIRLLAPAFLLGAVLTLASFGLTNNAIPWAVTNIERVVTQAMEDIFLDMLASQHYISDPEDGFSITVHDVRDRILIEPTFRYRNRDHQQITVTARAAEIGFDVKNRKGRIRMLHANLSIPGRDIGGSWEEYEHTFDMKEELGRVSARHMTVTTLREELEKLFDDILTSRQQQRQQAAMLLMTGDFEQLMGQQLESFATQERSQTFMQRRIRTEIHGRFAMAGSCLFFTLLGGPFAVYQARRQFITSFIMCFLPILLVYYPVMFLMGNLSKTGTIEPWWSMWVPNAIILAGAVVVLKKVVQH
ncbi:MAG: LptF/LptG family permease [Planctomycetaceae bacterium]